MEYKLFKSSIMPQLARIFLNDTKVGYLLELKEGKTELDLSNALNFRANGNGYYFDPSRLTEDIGVVLGAANDCTRTVEGDNILMSKTNIICTKSGKPTHLILGGVVPLCFVVGTDIKLLYDNRPVEVDATGEGSVVIVNAFSIKLSDIEPS